MHDSYRKRSLRYLTYLAGFFVTINLSFPAYINSSFVGSLLQEEYVGLIFAVASFFALIALNFLPRFLARDGLLNTSTLIGISVLVALAVLMSAKLPLTVIIAFIFYYVFSQLLKFNLDLYLEQISVDRITGGIRGVYMTIINLAWLISPYVAAKLVANGDYQSVYFVSALSLLPVIYILHRKLVEVSATPYPRLKIVSLLGRLWRHRTTHYRNIFDVLTIDFLLNTFYAIMVIYMPLYLHNHVGLTWPEIGIIFTIMLIPFVILDYPLGKFADRGWGEKELLITGLIITGLATFLIPLLGGRATMTWAALLFMTRVGAATIEIMKETYLFKHIEGTDIEIVSLSRMFFPLSFLIAPLIASALLVFLPITFLFYLLSLLMFAGLFFANRLQDTA